MEEPVRGGSTLCTHSSPAIILAQQCDVWTTTRLVTNRDQKDLGLTGLIMYKNNNLSLINTLTRLLGETFINIILKRIT